MTGPGDIARLDRADLPVEFGRYTLVGVLGEGGMGRVFSADLRGPAGFRKRVALKVLRRDLSIGDESARRELAQEARLGGLLSHPNVVETYEIGEVEGQLYVALALVAGPSLRQVLARQGPLPPSVLLDVAGQLCAGLGHIHGVEVDGRTGLIHRDVKPENVLFDRTGVVRLADLGIASLRDAVAATNDRRGTPSYMAPEQWMGDPLDARTDLFALGAVLFEAAAGLRIFPFVDDWQQTARAALGSDRLSGDADFRERLASVPGLDRVVAQCLRVRPADRWPDAGTLGAALAELRAPPGPTLAELLEGGTTTSPTPTRPRKRQPSWASAATIVIGDARPAVEPEPPTSPSAGRTGRRLPAEVDAFVGRSGEIDALLAALESTSLVTLKAIGGIGKTRLALRAGHLIAGRGDAAVFFADLGDARSTHQVLVAVAAALELAIGGDDDDALRARIGHALGARGRALLILDNFEQVAASAPAVIDPWRDGAPDLRILVTSRERLGLAGEQVLELAALDDPDAAALLRERASGQWDEAPETDLVALARRLDGIPLALELAAARARLLTPAQLAERLDERLSVLRSARRGAPARQATLQGALDWSWDMLAPWEQAALAQLSVFRGGFFLDDAERVLDLSDTPEAPWEVDVVGSLWDKSLLVSRRVEGQPRFGIYESVRRYAAAKLTDPSRAQLRHAERYARFGDEAQDDALRTQGGAERLRLLLLEHANLVMATENALTLGRPELAARTGLGASLISVRSGPYRAGLELCRRTLAANPSPTAVRARLLLRQRELAVPLGELDEATAAVEEAEGIARALGDQRLVAQALLGFAQNHYARGYTRDAVELGERAVAAAQRLGDRVQEAHALGALGRMLADDAARDRAIEVLGRSLALARQVGDRAAEAAAHANLAWSYVRWERLELAGPHFDAAVSLHERLGDRAGLARVHGNIGIFHRRAGRDSHALEAYHKALAAYRELGSRSDEAIVSLNLAVLHTTSGRWPEAEALLRDALRLARDTGRRNVETTALAALAEALRAQGRIAEALVAARASVALAEATASRSNEAAVRRDLGVLLLEAGQLAEARAELERADAVARLLGEPERMIDVKEALARVEIQAGDTAAAVAAGREALELARAEGGARRQALVGATLARALVAHGDPEAVAVATEATKHADLPGAVTVAALACAALARALLARGEPAAALEVFARAPAPSELPASHRSMLLGLRAQVAWGAGDGAQALACADEAVAALSPAVTAVRSATVRLIRAELRLSAGQSPRPDDLELARETVAKLGLGPETQLGRDLARVLALAGGSSPA